MKLESNKEVVCHYLDAFYVHISTHVGHVEFIRNQYSSDVLLRARMPTIARIVPGMNKRQTVLTSMGIH